MVASDRETDELLQDLVSTADNRAPLQSTSCCRRAIILEATGENTHAILLLTCLDCIPELPESRLMLLFRLTPAEARLAARLLRGRAKPGARAGQELPRPPGLIQAGTLRPKSLPQRFARRHRACPSLWRPGCD